MEFVGTAHYRGDVRRDVAGQVVGPVPTGDLVTPASASYDPETDLTTVDFRYATAADVQAEMDLHGVPVPGVRR